MGAKFLVLLVSLLTVACSARRDVGEWKPLTEHASSEELGVKFGVPNKNHVLDGLTFWEISPFVMQAPYAFQWVGDRLNVWQPNAENITEYQLIVSECSGLDEQLSNLLDSIGESASMMMADKVRNRDTVFIGSPTWYRIKYYPPDMLGSVTLNNIEYFKAPWIAEVKRTKAVIEGCLKYNNSKQ
ncbi:hypothetical protein [Pleionea litopenaei]|uniref:Uncharacterized protein n=1 Tax=Pleionea litopenaei TaxID=3070815 RepID=A0AA51RWL5_9GAMM|nr:hypothetical protein [Pleionea sp. HL-JVS1]WMS88783.1 hypothetical protein Q9312_07655 [Pleionea sp. HL-JVS1]